MSSCHNQHLSTIGVAPRHTHISDARKHIHGEAGLRLSDFFAGRLLIDPTHRNDDTCRIYRSDPLVYIETERQHYLGIPSPFGKWSGTAQGEREHFGVLWYPDRQYIYGPVSVCSYLISFALTLIGAWEPRTRMSWSSPAVRPLRPSKTQSGMLTEL